jgi:predicted transcriptional regulator
MARPKSNELTDRELAVMHAFWQNGEATAEVVRERLEEQGEQLAYVTVANVVRGLSDKGFLKQTHKERPFRYRAAKTFEDVSKRLVGDFVKRLFDGSRESMLVHVLRQNKLSDSERALLAEVLEENDEVRDAN